MDLGEQVDVALEEASEDRSFNLLRYAAITEGIKAGAEHTRAEAQRSTAHAQLLSALAGAAILLYICAAIWTAAGVVLLFLR